MYKYGLETAIARKGGYENIAFRKQRKTTAPIEFEITIQLSGSAFSLWTRKDGLDRTDLIELNHKFLVQTKGTSIRADFKVMQESFTFSMLPDNAENNDQLSHQIRFNRVSPKKFEMEEFEEGGEEWGDQRGEGLRREAHVAQRLVIVYPKLFQKHDGFTRRW